MAAKRPSLPGVAKPMPTAKWKRSRNPHGMEFFNYASALAQRLWLYLRAIGKSETPSDFQMHPEGEDGYLLHVVMRGRLWHRIRGRLHVVGPGDACLMDISEEVSYGNDGDGRALFYWALFNGKDMPQMFTELRADQEPIFGPIDPMRMESLFRELMAITNRPPPAYEPKASALLTMILAELFASRAPTVSFADVGKGRPLSDPVRKGVDCIARFYDQAVSIKQMAAAVGTSMFHFSRVFRRETGYSPIEYLNRYRLEQAKRLLQESDKSIEEISRSVGVRVPNYFAKIFRRHTGMTPRQFRDRNRCR